MNEMMEFPKTVEEFMESYKVVDTEGIYMSNGAELVPIFRMRQWFAHLPSVEKRGKWLTAYGDHAAFGLRPFYRYCSECGENTVFRYKYCPNCGARMEE